ncbi:MAG: transcriptional regulator [Parcubacteria group bacterium GW2011_GWC1_36_108]|nr:MAG: transcriptional regulator [Parcubacteria group bacterium GW2011_GWC1_36_108]
MYTNLVDINKNMRFSTKAEYGLKAMTNLAQCYPAQKTIGEIASQENISQKYLERLMGILRNGEVVQSSKGKQGGYVLSKDPKKIPVGEIIELLDGDIAPMRCVGKFCSSEHKCPSSVVWNKLGVQIKKTLYGMKLSDLIKN